MENEYLKSDLEDQKSQNDELKKLLMEMTEYSGVPEVSSKQCVWLTVIHFYTTLHALHIHVAIKAVKIRG